ncbi:hypothetical protein Hdeb2414_s0021g00577731 [Helianthus debilis subsp. tardiflorus]
MFLKRLYIKGQFCLVRNGIGQNSTRRNCSRRNGTRRNRLSRNGVGQNGSPFNGSRRNAMRSPMGNLDNKSTPLQCDKVRVCDLFVLVYVLSFCENGPFVPWPIGLPSKN